MKKSNLLQLLFCAMAVFAATAFTSCVDDNEDNGLPYLEVTPDALTFATDGSPVGEGTVVVKSNRPWVLTIEESDNWVIASPMTGRGTTTVEFLVPATKSGRSATLTFALKNTYGAYMTRELIIEQGEIGPVTRLNNYIKETWPTDPESDAALDYSQTTIEAVILANNADGNNRSKLYVGDNVTQPGSAIILFGNDFNNNPAVNYPVGKTVTLDLSNALYSVYNKLRQLKDVGVTVTSAPAVELDIPSISATQLNSGNYMGQYVRVNDMTPAAATVGKPWVSSTYQTLNFTGAGNTPVNVYMRGESDAVAFKNLTVVEHTGPMYGVAEQYYENVQIIPTKPADITGFFNATPSVTTGEATVVNATSVTLTGSLAFVNAPTKVGFQYLPYAAEPDWSAATDAEATLAGDTWTKTLEGLTQGRKYSWRAYAVNAENTYYGEMKSFTPDIAADITVDFSATLPAGFPTSKTAEGADQGKTWLFGDHEFGFYPSSGNQYYVMSGTALLIGKDGAYITLPAVEGKSLAKVRCRVNTGNPSTKPYVGVYNSTGTALQGGEAVNWKTPGESYEYILAGTAVNTSYRIQVASGGANIQVAEIELWYNEGGTPAQPTIAVDPDQLTFGAAADNTGKEVAVTTENAGDLHLYVSSTDATQFPMSAIADGKFTVKALANTSETDSKTATITVYLAEAEGGAHKAEATVTVSQAPSKPKTVAELRTQMKSMNPTSAGVAFPAEWIGQNVVGYIAANNASKNLNKMVAVVDNDNKPGSGMLLYDDIYNTNPETDFPVGRKITITITADSKAKVYNNLLELTEVTTEVSTSDSQTITPAEITANDLVTKDYQGMPVTVSGLKRSSGEYAQWAPAATGYVDFVGGSDKVSVATYYASAWAKEWISPAVTGAVSGIAQQNNTSYRIFPQKAADVAAFAVTEPAIVEVDPESISFPAAGGEQTLDLTILNQGGNAVTASGLSAPFSAVVEGSTVKVSATANTSETAVPEQTLRLTLANGNSVEIPVSQLAAGGLTLTLDLSTNPGFPTSYSDGSWEIDGYTWGGYRLQYTNKALTLQGSNNGWISTPAVAGMKLVEIQVTSSSGIANGSKMAVKDEAGEIVSAEQLIGKSSADFPGPFVFPVDNAAVNTSYRITATASNSQLVKIELIYTK